eukprot:gene9957-11789_t
MTAEFATAGFFKRGKFTVIDSSKAQEDPAAKLWREHRLLPPTSAGKQRWDLMMTAFVLYNCVFIPLQIAFEVNPTNPQLIADNVIDSLFIFDIVINFRTALLDEYSEYIVGKKEIATAYLNGWFPLDFVASFPFETVAWILKINFEHGTVLSMLKMPRLLRLGRLLKKLEQLAAANAFRIVKLMCGFLLIAHWLGCVWWIIGTASFNAEAEWGSPWVDRAPEPLTADSPITQKYLSSVYWALTMLMKTPWIHPDTVPELIAASVAVVLGAILFAAILGNVTSMIQSFDRTNAELRNKMSTLHLFVDQLKVPMEIQNRIFTQVDEEWSVTSGLKVEHVLNSLPVSLQRDVLLACYSEIRVACPLFEGLSEQITVAICKRLVLGVLRPDEQIMFKGAPSCFLLILVRGTFKVELISRAEPAKPKLRTVDSAVFGSSFSFAALRKSFSVSAENAGYPLDADPEEAPTSDQQDESDQLKSFKGTSTSVLVAEDGSVLGLADPLDTSWRCPYNVCPMKLTRFLSMSQADLASIVNTFGGLDAMQVRKSLQVEHQKLMATLLLVTPGETRDKDGADTGEGNCEEDSRAREIYQIEEQVRMEQLETLRTEVEELDHRLFHQSKELHEVQENLQEITRFLLDQAMSPLLNASAHPQLQRLSSPRAAVSTRSPLSRGSSSSDQPLDTHKESSSRPQASILPAAPSAASSSQLDSSVPHGADGQLHAQRSQSAPQQPVLSVADPSGAQPSSSSERPPLLAASAGSAAEPDLQPIPFALVVDNRANSFGELERDKEPSISEQVDLDESSSEYVSIADPDDLSLDLNSVAAKVQRGMSQDPRDEA